MHVSSTLGSGQRRGPSWWQGAGRVNDGDAQVAATANVNANTVVAPVSDVGLGLHTSVYAEFNNPFLPPY